MSREGGGNSIIDLMYKARKRFDREGMELFMALAWKLWYNRNDILWNQI